VFVDIVVVAVVVETLFAGPVVVVIVVSIRLVVFPSGAPVMEINLFLEMIVDSPARYQCFIQFNRHNTTFYIINIYLRVCVK
jgi:hypothetical protein